MNWVLKRAQCMPAGYIGELVKIVRRDVDRFNRLECAEEADRFFVVEPQPDGCEVHRARVQRFRDFLPAGMSTIGSLWMMTISCTSNTADRR